MKPKKKFMELEFCDAFMFAAAMEDEKICKEVLQCILGFPIKKVHVHTESMILVNPDYRGIRMDVYADDEEGSVYDVEMQTTNERNLPKRSRCYQGQIDVAALEPGDDVNKLKKSYVIFICTFDPFGRGRYRYTFEERCIEDGYPLGDETCKIFLNTRGTNNQEVSPELVRFLHFVENSESGQEDAEDPFLTELHNKIVSLKYSRRMEERYMLFGEMLDEERKEGRIEGRKEGLIEGRTSLLQLIAAMSADGRAGEIERLEKEPEFLEEMFEKYHIDIC